MAALRWGILKGPSNRRLLDHETFLRTLARRQRKNVSDNDLLLVRSLFQSGPVVVGITGPDWFKCLRMRHMHIGGGPPCA